MAKSRKNYLAQMPADAKIKDFLDMVSPSVIQFNVDHYLCGNTYRCVFLSIRLWAGQNVSSGKEDVPNPS